MYGFSISKHIFYSNNANAFCLTVGMRLKISLLLFIQAGHQSHRTSALGMLSVQIVP